MVGPKSVAICRHIAADCHFMLIKFVRAIQSVCLCDSTVVCMQKQIAEAASRGCSASNGHVISESWLVQAL